MPGSDLIATLETGLQQAQAIRRRLALRLEELRGEINRIKKGIAEVDGIIYVTQSAMIRLASHSACVDTSFSVADSNEGDEAELFDSPVSSVWPSKDIEVLSNKFFSRSITQSAAIILSESEKPLHVNEIYRRMVEGGYTFTSDNPPISIAGSLKRNPQFRKVAPNTFDLVFRELPTRRVS